MQADHSRVEGYEMANQRDRQQGQHQSQHGQSQRGFGSMDPERQREIAAEGGRAAHQRGSAIGRCPAGALR